MSIVRRHPLRGVHRRDALRLDVHYHRRDVRGEVLLVDVVSLMAPSHCPVPKLMAALIRLNLASAMVPPYRNDPYHRRSYPRWQVN